MATKQQIAQEKYNLLASVANPEASEGLSRPRSVLALWFLRNIVGFDDLDAYEFVSDGTDDRGVDALYVEAPLGDGDNDTLVLIQSKYPESPKEIGEPDIASFTGFASHFATLEALDQLLQDGPIEPPLAALIKRLNIRSKLSQGKLQTRLIFLTAGILGKKATQLVRAANQAHGADYLTAYDLNRLAPICEAFLVPQPIDLDVDVEAPESRRFQVDVDGRKQVVAAVKASDIVKWPGIEDRTLFDLNVRKELRPNRVSRSFRKALEKTADHENFLAFHNGLTVVSHKIEVIGDTVKLSGVSVVNGAQSVLGLNDRSEFLTDDLLLVVKFVEIGEHSQVAREVAWRSNSQNPVNARNLRALSGIQLRLEKEMRDTYPGYVYVTRPDASAKYTGTVIQNDSAAQLLCAVYTKQPWLAVKLLALFEEENYTLIFRDYIGASHIVLVHEISEAVTRIEEQIPRIYLGARKLTQLVMVYLTAELMRTEETSLGYLEDPATALENLEDLRKALEDLARHAAGSLASRAEDYVDDEEQFDDYKVDFKNREVLVKLAKDARKQYAYSRRIERRQN
ncbi:MULTISPECIES: AIPR family protein [unclassified Curtobacterium]|uniref:AIPR family protein n=1 Tax=unclassified Curtobacterium TaxID=257496 RepID=UPI00226B9950|nr:MULTISPECIES: AIPR family protein [unclassified Curtobacterium]